LLLSGVLAVVPAWSRDAYVPVVHVDNVQGDDAWSGAKAGCGGTNGPVRTFMRALHVAPPGACIRLARNEEPYRETFQIEGFGLGKAGAPLVVEGNGATVSGLIAIPSDAWGVETNDIYYIDAAVFTKLAPNGGMPKSNWLWHWKRNSWWHEPEAPEIFFLNGKPAPHAESLVAIQPGGFFLNINEHPVRIRFRLPAGKRIEDCRIDVPGNHGVIINDDHVVIRNLASMYSSDDGFSTFLASSVVFHNVYGAFNCDQGLSLHNSTSGLIEGGLFERNGGCGIADVMNTQTAYIQAVVRRNMVAGFWLAGASHNIQSCLISDNRGPQAVVCDGTRANVINAVVIGRDRIDAAQVGVEIQGDARLDHCTVTHCSVGVRGNGKIALTDSLFADCAEAHVLKAGGSPPSFERLLLDPAGTVVIGTNKVMLAGDDWRQGGPMAGLLKTCFVEKVLMTDPSRGLPDGHPLVQAGANRTRLGATIVPRDAWRPDEPVEIVPVTVFTHGVGRKTY
jgi:hypothetical protein